MLFFRSEELLQDWLGSQNLERGAVFPVTELWELSKRWYEERMSPDFHGRTVEQVREIFREFGLTSPFWQLP